MIQDFGRVVIVIGVILIVIGAIFLVAGLPAQAGKIPFLGKLPGDILIKKENFTFYAPIASAVLISIILSMLLTIIFNIKK